MSASDTDANAERSDAEWAAGVMGDLWCQHPGCAVHRRKNYDTDANDFRDLLNCEAVRKKLTVAVREHLAVIAIVGEDFPHEEPVPDQPAALRRLRSAMEADGEV